MLTHCKRSAFQLVRHARTYVSSNLIRPTFSRLFVRTPVTKSMLLLIVFGLVVVDCVRTRSDLDFLLESHAIRQGILEKVIENLNAGMDVDVQRELRIARAVSRSHYDTVDGEFDAQIDDFLNAADETVAETPQFVSETRPSDIRYSSDSIPQMSAPTHPSTEHLEPIEPNSNPTQPIKSANFL